MTFRMTSKITERHEKGIGPISFKRILLAGGAFVFGSFVLTRIVGFFLGAVFSFVLFVSVVVMTQPITGYPLLVWLFLSLKGLVTLAVQQGDDSLLTYLAPIMQIDPNDAYFNARQEYDAAWEEDQDETIDSSMSYIGSFGDATQDRKGLRLVANPFQQLHLAGTD